MFMREVRAQIYSEFKIATPPRTPRIGLGYGPNSFKVTGTQEWTREDGLIYGGAVLESEGTRPFIVTPRIIHRPRTIKQFGGR